MGDKKPTAGYHARTVEAVLKDMTTDGAAGLTLREGDRRLKRHGPNKLRVSKKRGPLSILVDQFKSMVILVLLIAGTVAFAFQHWAEGIAILAVLMVNAAIGFATEFKAVRSMEALKAMGGDTARVRRESEEREVDAETLVPGDIVILESGDMAPADIRLMESNNLRVNESALTGESVTVQKGTEAVSREAPLADRTCMLFKGTAITDGSGEGVVVATGMATQLGRISEMVAKARTEETPLQKRLDLLGRRLAGLTLGTAAVIAVAGLLAGQDPRKMVETAIALGVAAIPEGLPIVATIALARGMYLMARRNAVIKKLPAVETLGATQIIFTDKTGTLTENHMTLQRAETPGGDFALATPPGRDQNRGGQDPPLLRRILEIAVLCNNAALRDADKDNQPDEEQGDPTETALLRAGFGRGLQRPQLLEKMPEVREVPFDAEHMMMATYHRKNGGLTVAVKGAPDRVLAVCDRVADAGMSEDLPMETATRRRWNRKAEAMAADGLRVLAVADKHVDGEESPPYEKLRFLGLLGLMDPPRSDVREAIGACRSAGVRVIMVTGDQAPTAAAVAAQTGLTGHEGADAVIHGSDLQGPEGMSAARRHDISRTPIFARVSPAQKLNLVRLFQEEGLTVAMTGDGVNDAPALKKADIGVAMGQRGTDAAREVADMVLMDDAFATIVAAIRYGRVIFDNIRKSVLFMLCTNVAEVTAVAIAAVAGGFSRLPIPLLPLQILFLNVVTDVFPALALGMGAGEPGVMNKEPRPRNEAVLTRGHWVAIGGWSVLMAVCVLSALAVAFYGLGFEHRRAVTVSFLTLAFGKLWFVFNLRNAGSRLTDNDIVKNPFIWGAIALCILLLLAATYMPGLSVVLKTMAPGWRGWLVIFAMSLVPFLWGQTRRILQ